MPSSSKQQSKKSKPYAEQICFIICPIGKPASDERIRSDRLRRHIIEPVLLELGYVKENIIRADEEGTPGEIPPQIYDRLAKADLVIADLTDGNPNVLYELGIRHTYGEPVITMKQAGWKLSFDVDKHRTIDYDNDLDLADAARKELTKQISNIESFKSPVVIVANQTEISVDDRLMMDLNEMRSIMGSIYNIMKHQYYIDEETVQTIRGNSYKWTKFQIMEINNLANLLNMFTVSVHNFILHIKYNDYPDKDKKIFIEKIAKIRQCCYDLSEWFVSYNSEETNHVAKLKGQVQRFDRSLGGVVDYIFSQSKS